MKRAYFDTSAIVKLAHEEPYSQSLIDYLEEKVVESSTSVLAAVEVARALRRAGAPDDQSVIGFYLLALDNDICREASLLGPPGLRSLDAIHLATALAIGDRELEFITYDDRQADAARQAGLKVVQPGR